MNGMIRKHESDVSRKAGLLALGVHGVLLVAMIVSINWKAAHPPMQVTEVELWDKLPAKSAPKQVEPKPEEKPEPKPPEPKPEIKEDPKPDAQEPPKPKKEPDTPKVDIALEKKKQEKLAQEKKEQDKKEKEEATKKLAAEMREEQLRDEKAAEKAEAKKQADALKKLQNEALTEEKGESDKQASAANASLVGEFTEKIKAKVRGNVNKTLCSDGNPELRFEIGVLPSGELAGAPKLVKSSGNDACDEAVERAIMASEPLPLPTEASAKAQFRNLKLKFRPNE